VWPLADSYHVTNLLISASDITLQGYVLWIPTCFQQVTPSCNDAADGGNLAPPL
jgi:hypothetical protein